MLEGLNEKEEIIDIQDIEIVAGGINHSAVADANGFVYTCRSKHKWTAWNRR